MAKKRDEGRERGDKLRKTHGRGRGNSGRLLRSACVPLCHAEKSTHNLNSVDSSCRTTLEIMAIQGSAKRRGLRCVNSLPGSAWLKLSKQPRLFADLCIKHPLRSRDFQRRRLSNTALRRRNLILRSKSPLRCHHLLSSLRRARAALCFAPGNSLQRARCYRVLSITVNWRPILGTLPPPNFDTQKVR